MLCNAEWVQAIGEGRCDVIERRMTAEEVVEYCRATERHYRSTATIMSSRLLEAACKQAALSWEAAAFIVSRNLVPQWKGEPDSDGEHYVDGIERVCWVFRDDGGSAWAVEYVRTNPATGVSELVCEPLNGRRVCLVGCRPKGGAT